MSEYLAGLTGESFDPDEYISRYPEDMLMSSSGRRALCKLDPLLFALLYFGHHLASGENHDGPVTLSDFHLDMCRRTREWIRNGPHRSAEIAPRGGGKSTWNFLIRPMWALAHRHKRFIAAFADSGAQATQHLISFKRELDTNELLRLDHPKLCAAAKRPGGVTVADNRNLMIAESGSIFQAKGIDSSTLGSKVGNQRPDVILFDDIEPDESNYSELQKDQRAHSMINSVLPMNLSAVVVVSGTVTMPGSVVHDLVRTVTAPEGDWKLSLSGRPDVTEEGFQVAYYPALYQDDEGSWKSCWPGKWTVEFLQSIQHTSSFALNFQNSPRGRAGNYWKDADFVYGRLDAATRWHLEVDPAVTTKEKSDYTGLAVVGYEPPSREHPRGRCEVAYATAVKLVGDPFRDLILQIIGHFPQISLIRVESNQGGEMWAGPMPPIRPGEAAPSRIPASGSALHGVPVPVQVHHSFLAKKTRIAMGYSWYSRPGQHVLHRERLHSAEEQMISYPDVKNDDIVDAVCNGILYWLKDQKLQVRTGVKSQTSRAR